MNIRLVILWCLGIGLAVQSNSSAQKKYLSRAGTIFLYPKVIQSTDRSSFKSLGEAVLKLNVEMYDREANSRKGAWIRPEAYVFSVTYDDQISSEIRVREKDYSKEDATKIARYYATAMGRIPACLRKGIKQTNILKGDLAWGGNGSNRSLDLQIGEISEDYERRGIIEETLVHEACHAVLDRLAYNGTRCRDEWKKAQAEDRVFISKYAADNPCREDLAESFVPYLALIQGNRITSDQARDIEKTIAARIAFFDLQALDLYPLNVFPRSYFQMTTQQSLDAKVLEGGDGAGPSYLTKDKSVSGTLWKSLSVGEPGYSVLTTMFKEKDKLTLESGNGDDPAILMEEGNFSGRYWRAMPAGNGFYYLTSMYMEEERKVLTQKTDGTVHMQKFEKTSKAQKWKLIPIDTK